MQETEKKETETAEQTEQKPISDVKKTALMRYLTVMFAVAFMLVLVSFLIQNHSSNEQITQLSESANDLIGRAEKLQTQNRDLTDENAALQEQVESLTEELETLKNERKEGRLTSSQLKESVETYEALAIALTCKTQEGNVSFAKAMETLKYNQKYLSEPAKQIYRNLLNETTGE